MRFNSILLRSTGNSDRLLKKYHINQQNIKKLKKKKHESREFIGKFIYEKHCACCNFPKKKKHFLTIGLNQLDLKIFGFSSCLASCWIFFKKWRSWPADVVRLGILAEGGYSRGAGSPAACVFVWGWWKTRTCW